MSMVTETSDENLVDLLRRRGPLAIADLMESTGVTATAVRQRLNRLMREGLVERRLESGGRGRPKHRYSVTEKARRRAGSNFADLAVALWGEIRAVKDVEIRRGLIQRLAKTMASMYAGRIQGDNLGDRLESLAGLLDERGVTFQVDRSGELPVLNAVDCPYPELAEQDRGICAVEKLMFSELLDENLRLDICRFDGHGCCQFVPA